MTARRRQMYADPGCVAGSHHSFPVASGELSPDEVASRYSEVIVDGFSEFASDPAYLFEVVMAANRLDTRA